MRICDGTRKINIEVLQKCKIELSYDLIKSLMSMYQVESKSMWHRHQTYVHIRAYFWDVHSSQAMDNCLDAYLEVNG